MSSFQRLNVAIRSATQILGFCLHLFGHPSPFAGSTYNYVFFLFYFLLHLFPYFYVIFHPTITPSITQARISPSLSPRAATIPNSQLGQRGRGKAQMLAWPDQGRPAAALSLPFAAPTLMSKSDVVGAGKTAMILVFEGVCGAEMKETQSSGRIYTCCPAWQPNVNKVLAHVTKKWLVFPG